MIGLPSQLGYQLVNDVCKKPAAKLVGCCCAGHVQALWSMQLPVNVRGHISDMEFSAATYKDIFQSADRVYLSAKSVSVAVIAKPQVSAVSLDETVAAFEPQNQPQVAAVAAKPNKPNKGKGKGNKNNKGQKPPRKRHESMPPEACCDRHYSHGAGAWYCLQPTTCPWVSKVTPRT